MNFKNAFTFKFVKLRGMEKDDRNDVLVFVYGLKLLLGDESWCENPKCDITSYKINS